MSDKIDIEFAKTIRSLFESIIIIYNKEALVEEDIKDINVCIKVLTNNIRDRFNHKFKVFSTKFNSKDDLIEKFAGILTWLRVNRTIKDFLITCDETNNSFYDIKQGVLILDVFFKYGGGKGVLF